MKALLQRLLQGREARRLARRAIPDALWASTVAGLPFIARLAPQDQTELRRLATLFLDEKEFTGAGGFEVDDEIAVCIAVQACLPVLRFGLAPYRGFVGIVVHADEVVARREVTDDDGVVHEYDEVLTGEAMDGGPVMLSWRDVSEAGESADWGYNVVIHEFAHVLDMGDGVADGVPPLADLESRRAWVEVIDEAYNRFCHDVETGRDTLLDPYGATAIGEFFAVATEVFFVNPQDMRWEHPALYQLLADYFRQDPAKQP
ncbi:zinc-dependent peptidase [Ideonella sp. A 288]|uniref:M90 family metallopeptidase n=1 Tax=Ideonella sp. A 288 TaxID=1962181 RepID=UPI000B4B1116|nr:M90 family metallopeptidase [Ideonella sp. A 288]